MDPKQLRHGAFSWFELMTTDVNAAKQFYSQLLGWTTKDMPMGDMTYTVTQVDGEDVAGIFDRPAENKEMPPTWGIYITVENVDTTAAKAKELGGKLLVEPSDIPEVGRYCVIQDPQGASFAAMQYKS